MLLEKIDSKEQWLRWRDMLDSVETRPRPNVSWLADYFTSGTRQQ